jgi:16S rRNA (guanine966-N2)-methyltransferase
VVDALEAGNWLAENATIYIESGQEDIYQPPTSWQLHRDKHAGAVSYRLYYREQ